MAGSCPAQSTTCLRNPEGCTTARSFKCVAIPAQDLGTSDVTI